MLKLTNVKKKFSDFSLDVPEIVLHPGQIYGLVGHNGAGKSTFLKIAAGITQADSVNAAIDGNVLDGSLQLRKNIAFIPDSPALYDWMTVKEFSKFCARGMNESLLNLQNLISLYEVPSNKPIRQLSHGMRNKLEIAIAFSRSTDYVLMDEPVSGLDMKSRSELLKQIKFAAKNTDCKKSILFSSHSVEDIDAIVDSVYIFKQGKCVLSSSMESIRSDWYIKESNNADMENRVLVHDDSKSLLSSPSPRERATLLDVFLLLG